VRVDLGCGHQQHWTCAVAQRESRPGEVFFWCRACAGKARREPPGLMQILAAVARE
jgi:hypothetical protein